MRRSLIFGRIVGSNPPERRSKVGAAVKYRRMFGKSYDEWFASHAPVTRIQFWGLLLLGIMLIAAGLSLLVLIWSKAMSNQVDVFVILGLSIISIPSVAAIYFGGMHIKRALAGRHN